MWRGDANGACQYAGDCVTGCNRGCKLGCNNPARFRNPFFGKASDEHKWWRNPYNYAEWLCAHCYDEATSMCREWEEIYSEENQVAGSQEPEDV